MKNSKVLTQTFKTYSVLLCLFFVQSLSAHCPAMEFVDLKGISGFSRTDDLNVCGDSDALSILMYTDAPGQIAGFEFAVDVVPGMHCAAFEEAHKSGCKSISSDKYIDLSMNADPVVGLVDYERDSCLDDLPLMAGYVGVSADKSKNDFCETAQSFVKNNSDHFYIDAVLPDYDILASHNWENQSFHLFSHGAPGQLLINGQWYDQEMIIDWITDNVDLNQFNQVNIYGCEFAKGNSGKDIVSNISKKLGITISASDNITGIDGDWDLEVGELKPATSIINYKANLQSCTTSVGNVGTAGQAMDGSTAPFILPVNCPLESEPEAEDGRGFMIGCAQSACPISQAPPAAFDPPSITCPIQYINYMIVEPIDGESVYMQYWNNCIDGVSGLTTVNFSTQGFINQLFCELDAQGYPMAPTSIGTPAAGIVSALPAMTEDIDGLLSEIDGDISCASNQQADTEMIQSDFWIVLPATTTTIGFKVGGRRADAALFMVGTDINNLCATSELIHTSANGRSFEGIEEVFYEIPAATTTVCGGIILRARFYTTDIGAQFTSFPELDIGNGFDRVDNIAGAAVIPATGPADNVIPTISYSSDILSGFIDDNDNVFALDGTYEPLACPSSTPVDIFDPVTAELGELCDDTSYDLDELNAFSDEGLSFTYATTSADATIAGTMLNTTFAPAIADGAITVTATGPTSLPADEQCEFTVTINYTACDLNCDNIAASGIDLCDFIMTNPTSSLATEDCDGGGIDNFTECFGPGAVINPDGTITPDPDPTFVPTDPAESGDDFNCDNAALIPGGICAYIAANPGSNIATLDCDGGGVDNATECDPDGDPTTDDGTDPLDNDDDYNCESAAAAGLDICDILADNPDATIGMLDCDGGGVSNADECFGPGGPVPDGMGGFEPSDPDYTPTDPNPGSASDDYNCDNFSSSGLDMCDFLADNPNTTLATMDCDGGGVDNFTECFGPGAVINDDGTITPDPDPFFVPTDPTDTTDDYNCDNFAASGLDLCEFLAENPTSNMATLDCDGGGVDNATECANGDDPLNPADDINCDNAFAMGIDICTYILGNPGSNIATMDCDGGGIDNATECAMGGNPIFPGDDAIGDCTCLDGICTTNTGNIAGNAGDPFDGTAAPFTLPPNCLLLTDDEARDYRGFMYACSPTLPTSSVCTTIPEYATPVIPTFSCPAESIEYSVPVTDKPAYMQYWSNCVPGVSGLPTVTAAHQGFINQLFCDTDANGYPLAPADAGTPLEGCISTLPAIGPRVSDAAVELDPSVPCAGSNGELEMIQLDFWMLIPDYVTDIGVQIGGGGADAGLVLVGSSLTDLAPVAELVQAGGGNEAGTPTGYFCLPATTPACTGQYLRFRIYMTDIAVGFDVSPMINLGSGFVDFVDEPLITMVAATGPDDNTPPGETRETLMGFQDMDGNIFAADMTYEPMGCLVNVIPGDACDCDMLAAQGIDICDYILLNPLSGVGALDCDGGGVDNATECAAGTDPSAGSPEDDCDAAIAEGVDICALVLADPTSPLATADCDGGGENNLIECQNGGDPTDPVDDNCDSFAASGIDLCVYLALNPGSPLATLDCDGGGLNNIDECNAGGDPFNPVDDSCDNLETMVADPCAFILANPTNPMALADCDGGGVSNYDECVAGGNPFDPVDDSCDNFEAMVTDPCAYILANPTSPMALADCDGGGVSNVEECAQGGDPFDPMDDSCDTFEGTGEELCELIMANPTGPLALADCDGGGVSNIDECNAGGNPLDPIDDSCDSFLASGQDLCVYLAANPTSPLATMDCDGGGLNNIDECNAGGDPFFAADDSCDNFAASGIDLCAYLALNPGSPMATMDCDGGGVDNQTECDMGGDPLNPADDSCDNFVDSGLDLCDYLAVNIGSPMATADCDGGGVSNADECADGGDPLISYDDSCEEFAAADINHCEFILANPNNPMATADCDGGGVSNFAECMAGGDPFVDYDDSCDAFAAADINHCEFILANPTSPMATADCDGGGVSNLEECQAGGDPLNPIDDSCENFELGTTDPCAYILANPTSPMATADCDGGGVNNLEECMAGGDPFNPIDDSCENFAASGIDLCAFLALNPTSPLATLDCDDGGLNNIEECNAGGDPFFSADDSCDNFAAADIDHCAYILANPTSPMATADCDGGGVSNIEECMEGGDPFIDYDDSCEAFAAADIDHCAFILANPTNPMATADCDGGGVSNLEECEAGGDPLISFDDSCEAFAAADINHCEFILANPTNPMATADCDGGGIDNLTECMNGDNPFDPSDDYDCDNFPSDVLDICDYILENPTSDMATLDCDGGGVNNADECALGFDPFDDSDDAVLEFEKSASTPSANNGLDPGLVDAGDEIVYTYVVTNSGAGTITNVTVNDPGPNFNGVPGTNGLNIICPSSVLVSGATMTCTAVYVLSQTDIDNGAGITDGVTNTANASGDGPNGPVDTPDDTAVTEIPAAPMLDMEKSAAEPTILLGVDGLISDAGDEILYSYEVCNTGNVTLTAVAPMDSGPTFNGTPGTNSLSAFNPLNAPSLEPGACQTFTAVYVMSQADVNNAAGLPGAIMNTANASGTDPSGGTTTSPDDDAQTDIANAPMLDMEKSAGAIVDNGDGIVNAGDQIPYSYEVTNTGNVTMDNVMITDPGPAFNGVAGTGTMSAIVCVPTTLAPGESVICTATYTLTDVDVANGAGVPGGVMNTANASGTDPQGNGIDSPDDSAVTSLPCEADASWTPPTAPICDNDTPPYALSLDNINIALPPAVVSWSGLGVTDNGDGTGSFNPTGLSGFIDICVTVFYNNQCEATECHTIEVIQAPTLPAPVSLDFTCQIGASGSVSLSQYFPGIDVSDTDNWVISGGGAGNIVGGAMVYDEPGCYDLTLTYVGPCVVAPAEVTSYVSVSEQPQPSFDIQDQVCWSAGDPVADHIYTPLINSPTYAGIVTTAFTVSGPATLNDPITGEISVTGVGIVTLCLTETSVYPACGIIPGGACVEEFCFQITVQDGTSQDATFSVDNTEPCIGDVVTYTANVPGGQFSGVGVVDDGNGLTATLTVTECGPFDVTYSLNTPNGCNSQFTIRQNTDGTPPAISVPAANEIVECDGAGNEAAHAAWVSANGGAVATDNCTFIWSSELLNVISGCGATSTRVYRFTATDECGNASSTEASFIIEDTSEPVITPGADMAMNECENDPGGNFPDFDAWLASNAGATATDVCGSVTWTNDFTPANFVETCPGSRSVDVVFTATDDCGNTSSVTHTWAVGDNTPPEFTNCERLPVVTAAPETWCEAFVNFSPPAAADNCSGDVTVTQVDNSGLNSGSVFPVGTTELTFVAVDECGNSSECSFKVIVNDFHTAPEITSCPGDQSALCGEDLPNDLAIEFEDNCPDNSAVIWKAEDPSGAVVASGMDVLESTTQFTVGDHNVSFRVQDQPLLLITEVVQAGTDMIEISNLGPATVDLNCLTINRYGNGVESDTLPAGTSLAPGAVLVYTFTTDIAYGDLAAYTLEYMDATFDQLAVNGYGRADWTGTLNGGDVCRVWNWDHDAARDWKVTLDCTQNIGVLNNTLDVMANNGTSTSLQSEVASASECSFVLSVGDDQAPMCAAIAQEGSGRGTALPINPGMCNESTVNITQSFTVDYVQINGLEILHTDIGQVSAYLIAPDGTQVKVFDGLCPGTSNFLSSISDTSQVELVSAACGDINSLLWFRPEESFNAFNGLNSAGLWTLNVMGAGLDAGSVVGWELQLFEFGPYTEPDLDLEVTQQAGTEHTWTHPLMDDNCCMGTIVMNMSLPDGTVSSDVVVGGSTTTEFFPVGCTQVDYTLTDCGGNRSRCGGFEVCVTDNFIPASCCDDDFTCISQLNVSLNEMCMAEFTSNMGGVGLECQSIFYDVELFDEHGDLLRDENNMPTTKLGVEHINQNLTFRISNNDPLCDNGNSCWGNLLVEFKNLPQIDCPPNLTLTCAALDMLPLPEVATNQCAGTATVRLANEIRERLDCDDRYTHRVSRTYVATDAVGNSTTCEQEILLERIDLSGLQFPITATIKCSELDSFILLPSGIPRPFAQAPNGDLGIPFLCTGPGTGSGSGIGTNFICPMTGSGTGVPIIPDGGLSVLTPDGPVLLEGNTTGNCSAVLLFTDIELPQNGCDRKVLRTFEVREWFCGTEIPATATQLIEIRDDLAPEVTCPAPFMVTTNDDCAGSVQLPPATVIDACANGDNVRIEHPRGTVDSNGGFATLDIGVNLLRYVASDNCGNIASCTTTVTVRDNTEPVAICERATVVSISLDGNTIVPSDVFDDGSWDECGEVTTCAMKMSDVIFFRSLSVDTVYQGISYVERSRVMTGCDPDIDTGLVLDGVEFLSENDLCIPYIRFCCSDVGDEQLVVFRALDKGGNFSDCMVSVEVQDKAIPSLTCPVDRNIDCREPIAMDQLNLLFGSPEIVDNCAALQPLNEIVDANQNQCGIGTIERTFNITDNFGNVVRSCKQLITITNQIPFTEADIEFPLDFTADCGTAAQLVPEILEEPFAFPRFLRGNDACSMLGVDYRDEFFAEDPQSGDCGVIRRAWTVIDWCTEINGQFATFPLSGPYIQTIKIENDIAPVIDPQTDVVFDSASIDCDSGQIALSRTAMDDCTTTDNLRWSFDIVDANGLPVLFDAGGIPLSGNAPNFSGTFATGTYSVTWTVCDGCGNCTTVTQMFEVVNTKPPVPICHNALSITLDHAGVAEFWAEDIDAGSYHLCGNPVTVGFDEQALQQSITFGCSDVGTQRISLYVRDSNTGVTDFCVGVVEVQDPLVACGGMMVAIQGEVFTPQLESIESVVIDLSETTNVDMTDEDGEYAFFNMPMGGDYEVIPSKDGDDTNGVNTIDLIRIQRHILGLERFDNPYQLMAADINGNQKVDGADLVELRKLILGVYTEFPDNSSWRFVQSEYTWQDSLNPWSQVIDETYEILDLSTNMDIDFVGVKIGDVDNTAVTNSYQSKVDMKSYRWPLNLEVPSMQGEADAVVHIPVYGRNYEQMQGWQMTLAFNPTDIEILTIESGALNIDATNYNIASQAEGWMTMSYGSDQALDIESDEPLFEIVVRAESNINVADLFEISSSVTEAEAYRGDYEIVNVGLDVRAVTVSNIVSVSPNPWMSRTRIEFHMPDAGSGRWEFYDVNGGLVYRKEGQYVRGLNNMTLTKEELGADGIVYIKLTTDYGVSQFKMIVVQ